MKLIANRQLTGDYGTVSAGEELHCSDEVGRQLLDAGVARSATPPRITYETKVITPEAPEVGARRGFCDRHLFDAQSPGVAPEGDSLLPAADLPVQGNVDRSRRRSRPRPDPK